MPRQQTIDEIRWLVRASRAQKIRPIRQFAEEEIIIPEGVHEGTRYRADTLPWQRLWLDEIDSGRWNRFILTACVQGGKTLVGWVVIILWHIFEWKENFGAGVPNMDQAGDKWRLELLPAIEKNPRLRELLPDHGAGSKGGKFEALEFKHGPTLKFLSGKGGDEKRSSITLRGSAVTEADRLDHAGEASREAAPIYQIEGRSASFEDNARFYGECTSTITSGFVARETKAGSDSRIMCPCPHCTEYVCLEREHLVGWEGADNEIEARANAAWFCPHCAVVITEDERQEMNQRGVLIHRGQMIERDGTVIGDLPPTRTLGFRANAFNNLLWSGAYIAAQEWLAKHDKDPESAEKKLKQWYWALAVEPNAIDVTPLELEDILGRQDEALTRGVVPPGTLHLSGAADVRKTQIHFVVVAWYRNQAGHVCGHVVDLGVMPVDSKKFGVKKALLAALRSLRDRIEKGYVEKVAGDGSAAPSVRIWRPGWFPIDVFWYGSAIRQFVRESKALGIKRYIPSLGRGMSAEHSRGRYKHPTKESQQKPHVGEEYYIAWQDKYRLHYFEPNCDHWKTEMREALAMPEGEPGALSVFDARTEDEQRLVAQFAKEIIAERAYLTVIPEKGEVLCYANDANKPNHFGDALYNSFAAGHLCGVRIEEPPRIQSTAQPQPIAPEPLMMPDGRPFFINNRDE